MLRVTGLGEVRVVPDDVREVGRFALEVAQNLRQALESAGRDVDALTARWRSAAGDAFGDGWADCRASGTDISHALADLALRLGVSAEEFRRTDARSSATLTSLDLP